MNKPMPLNGILTIVLLALSPAIARADVCCSTASDDGTSFSETADSSDDAQSAVLSDCIAHGYQGNIQCSDMSVGDCGCKSNLSCHHEH